eukprot:12001127-Ditylum_brightwellii.AAC.1
MVFRALGGNQQEVVDVKHLGYFILKDIWAVTQTHREIQVFYFCMKSHFVGFEYGVQSTVVWLYTVSKFNVEL